MPSQPMRTTVSCVRLHRRIPHADWPHPQRYPHELNAHLAQATQPHPHSARGARSDRVGTRELMPAVAPALHSAHLPSPAYGGQGQTSSLFRMGSILQICAFFFRKHACAHLQASPVRSIVQLAIRRLSGAMLATGSSCSLLLQSIGRTPTNHTSGIQVPSQPATAPV